MKTKLFTIATLAILGLSNKAFAQYTKLLDFAATTNGSFPRGSLMQASDGMLYGMTNTGGANGAGVLFQYNPATNTYTDKLDLVGPTNGKNPHGSLMQASDGMLYGMTLTGGANNAGVLFQYNSATNTYTDMIDFAGGVTNGKNPQGSLIQASDGMLYGMTNTGGASNMGVLFQYNPATNTLTDKLDFAGATNGSGPIGSLMQASDGMLYGMTYNGGANNLGVLFQYNSATNTYTDKIDFAGATNGSGPMGSLMQASDGMLYGMTFGGGASGFGVIFQYNPATNALTKKLDFAGGGSGSNLYGDLMQASDGKLYGMTNGGGASGFGVIFQYNPATNALTKKLDFAGTTNGSNPYGSLMQASDGMLYGMTNTGGASTNCSAGCGTLFKICMPPIVTVNNATICTGTTTTLTASGANTYTWSANAGSATTSTVSVAPNINTTYTVTGTDVNTCTNTATSIVYVYNLPTVLINGTNGGLGAVCTGSTTTLTASGASTFTWNTSETTSVINPSPSVTTDYTVTGTDWHTCANTSTFHVQVNPLPPLTVNSATVCYGSYATLSASGCTTYTWSPGPPIFTSTTSVAPMSSSNYTVAGTDANTCTNTAIANVTVNPLPTVLINGVQNGGNTLCSGRSETLTASGAITYFWSDGVNVSTDNASPTASTTYTVMGIGANNCQNSTTWVITIPAANPAPEICVVSTDSATNYNYNVIYWNKTLYTNVDSFIVYRYGTSSYLVIGRVSKDSLSMFVDANRSIGGPNGGDPNIAGWQYALAIKDTCGNISALSPYHLTANFQQNNNNLSWSAYQIQSPQSNPTTSYQVLRDSLGTNDYRVFANTSYLTTSTQDPLYATYPNANYRVDAMGFNCTATLRLSGNNSTDAAKIRSHSNQNNNRHTSGINKLASSNGVSVYPNPASTIINLMISQFDNANTNSVEIYNTIGECVYRQIVKSANCQIDVSNLAEGVYQFIIHNEGVSFGSFTINKKVVIVR